MCFCCFFLHLFMSRTSLTSASILLLAAPFPPLLLARYSSTPSLLLYLCIFKADSDISSLPSPGAWTTLAEVLDVLV